MNIAIVGAGSLGRLWAFRLSSLNAVLITRTYLQKSFLEKEGLIYFENDRIFKEVIKVKCIQENDFKSFDIILVMVKQKDLPNVVSFLKRVAHPFTQVVFWQNGLGHEKIAKELGLQYTYAAITTEGCFKVGRNRVIYAGEGKTYIGSFPKFGLKPYALLVSFVEILKSRGLAVKLVPDISFVMWKKLAVNCLINPLTALYKLPNGELLSKRFEYVIQRLLAEILEVAKCCGVSLSFEEILAFLKEICLKTRKNKSSMLQDLLQGKKTEIDFLNNAIVSLAQKFKIKATYNSFLVKRIKEKEAEVEIEKKVRC